MTKEELEQLKSTVKQWLFHTGSLDPTNYANELKLKFIEPREKRIAELEEKISVLFSCKNCPENKGGLICAKEYENKCLAQKIQFIKELQEENAELQNKLKHRNCLDCSNHSSKLRMRTLDLEKENAELRKIAEFQQSSNMNRHFENKKLKEGLEVGSTFNKALNSMNKNLEEERDKYRNMVFDQKEQLIKAKEYIKLLLMNCVGVYESTGKTIAEIQAEAEQFLTEVEK